MTTIIEALGLLETANDGHWTADGLPRVDIVADIVGDKALKRGDITQAAPTFTRENPTTEVVEKTDEGDIPDNVDPSVEPLAEIHPALDEAAAVPIFHNNLDEDLALAKNLLKEAQKVVDEAQRNYFAIQSQIDALIEAKENVIDPHANQLAISAYLATQQKLREQRAGVKTPIDQAMVRRTGFGGGRPVRPLTPKV